MGYLKFLYSSKSPSTVYEYLYSAYPNITDITMSLVIHELEDHIACTIIPNWGFYMKYIIQSKVFRFNLILYSMSVISDFSE